MRIYNWEETVKRYLQASNGRKIVLVGNDAFTVEIAHTITHLNYPLSIIVTEFSRRFSDINEDVKIKNWHWFKENSLSDVYVIGAMYIGHKELYTELIKKGKKLDKDFSLFGIGGYTKLLDSIDSLLALNRENEDMVGFHVWDNCENKGKKIVILGNSTSDPSTGNIKSWPECLYDILNEMGIEVTIYNGAITGYSSTQEFLKLNRDVLLLNPDIVISFSGYNDVEGNSTVDGFPFLHKYENKFYNYLLEQPQLAPDSMYVRSVSNVTHGLQNIEADYKIWLDNMRKMNVICKEFGIKFIGVLQPMVDYKVAKNTIEHKNIVEEFLKCTGCEQLPHRVFSFCEKLEKEIVNYPYILNLTGIFKDEYNAFYDTCHYTQNGNKIIADKMYEYLKGDL